jgi:hypothetical protein
MKGTSKHWRIVLACVVAAIGVTCAARESRRTNEATADVWTSDGGRAAHARASAARAVCAPSRDRSGWEFRLDGSDSDAVRRVDVEIPRAESSGTASFYAGVTTMHDGRLQQWVVETRALAARHTGEGRAWAESAGSGVHAAVIARLESAWYFVAVRCPMAR